MSVLFLVFGAFLIGWGLHRLKGPVSVSYLASSPYLAASAYGPLPFGLAFLIWSFIPFAPETWRLWLFLASGAIGILGPFALGKFLKPSWVQWLESEHGKLIPILSLKIQKMGYEVWDRRINTQEELEVWVEEVRRKYYGPPLDDQ